MSLLKLTGRMPPIVFSAYAPLPAPTPGKPVREVVRKLLMRVLRGSVDAVAAPSTFAKGVLISQGGFADGTVHRITFGVDFEKTRSERKAGQAPLVLLLSSERTPAARRAARGYFLQAAQAVVGAHRKARFTVICPREERGGVLDTASRFGVRANVDTAPPEETAEALERSDIAVLPTGDVTGIRPLVTAMASGAALVAPDLRGVREFVAPDESGVLVRPSDSQALAEALVRLLSSTATRTRLAGAAAAHAAGKLTLRQTARELITLYEQLIS
jgi:glycosyltransferase involved in cell wall biosynthesis